MLPMLSRQPRCSATSSARESGSRRRSLSRIWSRTPSSTKALLYGSTRMCLEALEARVGAGMRVLDVGCGSGILSVVAAKLGALAVGAIDIDPNCVRITRGNAQINAVGAVVHAECAVPEALLGSLVGK